MSTNIYVSDGSDNVQGEVEPYLNGDMAENSAEPQEVAMEEEGNYFEKFNFDKFIGIFHTFALIRGPVVTTKIKDMNNFCSEIISSFNVYFGICCSY